MSLALANGLPSRSLGRLNIGAIRFGSYFYPMRPACEYEDLEFIAHA